MKSCFVGDKTRTLIHVYEVGFSTLKTEVYKKKKTKQNHGPFHDLSACTQSQRIMMNYSTNVIFPFGFKVSHEVDDHVKIRIFYSAFFHFMIDLSEV